MADQLQVKVLYDFEAQPSSGELSIFANEILNVTRKDVGEGWWEGVNSKGEVGLFPAAYVEIYSSKSPPPPSVPPPPLPDAFAQPTQPAQSNFDAGDDWDDDWDDDDSNYGGQDNNQQANHGFPQNNQMGGPNADAMHVLSMKNDNSSISRQIDIGSKGTVKKNINRFSSFVKTGGEAFILGTTKVNVDMTAFVTILDTGNEIMWEPSNDPYTCTVASPKKESKLKGLKSFIAYQITPSFNNIQTSRRYKHFDWLHERLENKFPLIPVPPIPGKQITGRYEDDFIEHRRLQLEKWVDRVCRHPVLSQCEVWRHFLTCSDAKQWKAGKRRAEKDELVGAVFCYAIKAPESPLEITSLERQMDNFLRFATRMDDSVKQLLNVSQDQIKKYYGSYKREFLKISDSIKDLGTSFELEPNHAYSDGLTRAIKHTGETYERIGKLYEEQPKNDFEPMTFTLYEYKGMLNSWPEILNVHKGALNKKREYQKLTEEGRLKTDEAEGIAKRTDVVSYAILAEMTNFKQERVADYKYMMQCFLTGQINFYQKIVDELQGALTQYDSV